jgi:hypothetical protein
MMVNLLLSRVEREIVLVLGAPRPETGGHRSDRIIVPIRRANYPLDHKG